MAKQRRARPHLLGGLSAYLGVCLLLASASWIAVGQVFAADPKVTFAPQPSVEWTSMPVTPTASLEATPTGTPTPVPAQTAYPTPQPDSAFFQEDVYRDGTFVSQMNHNACMAGALQNMLNIIGPRINLTVAHQVVISQAIVANTTKEDSLNGGYGPEGWAITLTQMGAGNYKLLIDNSLNQALHDAVTALRRTGRPVGLLSWWGAHSWVMTGFRTDRDPRKAPNTFKVLGTFIVDPFYPRHSSIWGQTMGPDSFRNMADMVHNYIGWKRPEGKYPGRDGKWLLVVPY